MCDLCFVRHEVARIQVGKELLGLCGPCRDHILTECTDLIQRAKQATGTKTLTLNDDKAAVEAAAKRGYSS